MTGGDEPPRSLGSRGSGCKILSVGDVVPGNGHDVLLRALVRLFDLDWHLTIVGAVPDPVYLDELRGLAEGRRVSFAEVADWRTADVFALTPAAGTPLPVFAEALRRGVPIVATRVAGEPDQIQAETGLVCPAGDVEQLSKSLRRLIFDQPLRHAMAEAAWLAGRSLRALDGRAAVPASVPAK